MQDIQRQVFGPVAAHDFLRCRIRIVAPAALLIPQRPLRRHGQVAGKIGVASQDLLDRRTLEEVVIHLAALGGERHMVRRFGGEVEMRAITVIEENTVRFAGLPAKIERNVLVDRIGAFLIGGRVGVPHGELAAPLVEAGGLFAQAVEMLVEAELFDRGNRVQALAVHVRVPHHGSASALMVRWVFASRNSISSGERWTTASTSSVAISDVVRLSFTLHFRNVPRGSWRSPRSGRAPAAAAEGGAHANQVRRQDVKRTCD
jgi:hypothetical protein